MLVVGEVGGGQRVQPRQRLQRRPLPHPDQGRLAALQRLRHPQRAGEHRIGLRRPAAICSDPPSSTEDARAARSDASAAVAGQPRRLVRCRCARPSASRASSPAAATPGSAASGASGSAASSRQHTLARAFVENDEPVDPPELRGDGRHPRGARPRRSAPDTSSPPVQMRIISGIAANRVHTLHGFAWRFHASSVIPKTSAIRDMTPIACHCPQPLALRKRAAGDYAHSHVRDAHRHSVRLPARPTISPRRPTRQRTCTARPKRTDWRSGQSKPTGCRGTPRSPRSWTGRRHRSRSGSSAASSTSPTTASTATSRPATATGWRSTGRVSRSATAAP